MVADLGGSLLVGGHTAAAASRDGGRSWQAIPSLNLADPMSWAVTEGAVLVAGHAGLFRSTDGGNAFQTVPLPPGVSDLHALGGAGDTVFAASSEAGLMVSADGGASWEVRSASTGQAFRGSILVDPEKPIASSPLTCQPES